MSPMPMIMRVERLMNLSPVMVAEMVKPRRMVTMLASSFWADWERRSVTPLTRSRLPNMRKPSRATEAGAMIPASRVTAMGKTMRSRRGTSRWT